MKVLVSDNTYISIEFLDNPLSKNNFIPFRLTTYLVKTEHSWFTSYKFISFKDISKWNTLCMSVVQIQATIYLFYMRDIDN